MSWTTVRKRALYLAEALAIMLAIVVGLESDPDQSRGHLFRSGPRPGVGRGGTTGLPRSGEVLQIHAAGENRRYLHVCAVLCFGVVDLAVVNVVIHAR